MTINEVIKNMDVEEFLKQKEWLTEQIAELSPAGGERFPEGILTFLEQIQDAAEKRAMHGFYGASRDGRSRILFGMRSGSDYELECKKRRIKSILPALWLQVNAV